MSNKQSGKGTGSDAIISQSDDSSNGLPSGMMAQHAKNAKQTVKVVVVL